MSPNNTPSRSSFNQAANPAESHPTAVMGSIGRDTQWNFRNYRSFDHNQSARQMDNSLSAFSGAPAQASEAHPNPFQIPLPALSDADLHHGPTIANLIGYAPASKVAGSHHATSEHTLSSKAKGKHKHVEPLASSGSNSDDVSDAPPAKKTAHGGRHAGAGNYGDPELKQLLCLVKKELPVGQNGWKRIHEKYATWAKKHGCSLCDAKALEAKFKLLVKTKKPTGSGKRPKTITHAKAIDKLINEKVGTRNLNDSEIDNDKDEDGFTSDLDKDTKKHVVIAQSDKTEGPATRRTRGNRLFKLNSS
ncbi:hypothetical protein B0H34DRAFT_801727 [Crassisporium funariophilum]|nr:hypothetical protein B0H34DRAFT_801727 [Crassisporium funariophilum]